MKFLKMPVVKSMIRNSPRNALCLCILLLISFAAVGVLHVNHEVFIQYFRVCFTDPSSSFHLCFGIVTVIVLSSLIRLLLLFAFEDFLSGKNSAMLLDKLKEHLTANEYLYIMYAIVLFLQGYMALEFSLVSILFYIFGVISTSILFPCMDILWDYDDVDLSSSQNIEQSIGACWAHGAYLAFYKKILPNITERMVKFEKEHNITLLVRKLVIICPLSCNANGSLTGKDGNITKEETDHLEVIIEDDGANNNRTFKTDVYTIHGPHDSYIAAEIPSPLATLYEMRNAMDSVILNYHRECFIKTLSDLVKSDQCIILEYDDLNSTQPLHSFLLSRLENQKFIDVN